MLDGLLGRGGFSSKCKSLIKPTRARIEALRRRAEAKQRFLKEDLAKLLANGLDVNAYGRTEEFIAGLNLLSCYNFIDQSCEYILKQLSIMQKQGQCPEECRETVASLMFAAARFCDLPELRDLRDVFQERYGNGLECFVNQVFVEKLASKPPVIEKRVKLLQDIAAEFSIQWDSNGFKQRMDKPPTSPPEFASEHNNTPLTIKNPGSSYRDRKPEALENRGRKEKHLENRDNDDRLFRGTHGFEKNDTPLTIKNSGSSYRDKKPEIFDNTRMNRGRKEKHIEKGDNDDRLFRTDPTPLTIKSPRSSRHKRPEILGNDHVTAFLKVNISNVTKLDVLNVNDHLNQQNAMKSTGKVHEEEKEIVTLNSLPPPYVKSNIPPPYSKPNDHRSKRITLDSINTISDTIKKERDHGPADDRCYQNDIPLPKPRSMRRKYSKSASSHEDIGSSEDSRIVKRISSSRRKERKGLQILFDDEHYQRDDEEKMMDKLLLHYSKKPSAYDIGKLKKKKSRSNTSKSPHHRSKDEVNDDVDINIIAPPARSISLPRDQIGESEPKKVYARANSFQPDNQAKHVHPKLPDYDDLAARFAALRGR